MSRSVRLAVDLYEEAKRHVNALGLCREVEWQRSRIWGSFSESDLLRETAWVILCTGFRERVVRRLFDYVSLCFCDWESAECIVEHADICRAAALKVFANRRKIDSIVLAARVVHDLGYLELKRKIERNPISELQRFPFIGPVTSWHLAKNLGFDVAKPDRHLVRLSSILGFKSAHQLCAEVSSATGEPVSVVDITFWRFAASAQRSWADALRSVQYWETSFELPNC